MAPEAPTVIGTWVACGWILFNALVLCVLYRILKAHPAKGQYLLGRLRGYMEGVNGEEEARRMIRQDIKIARESLVVVSCTANTINWNEEVVAAIREKAKRGVYVLFLVGPQFQNEPLLCVYKEGLIKIRVLPSGPPCDLRIIDNRGTYISNHGGEGCSRRFHRTFGNREAVKARTEEANRLFKQSRPYEQAA